MPYLFALINISPNLKKNTLVPCSCSKFPGAVTKTSAAVYPASRLDIPAAQKVHKLSAKTKHTPANNVTYFPIILSCWRYCLPTLLTNGSTR